MSSSPAPIVPDPMVSVSHCRVAITQRELAHHHLIRHEVFVGEQALFAGSDRDDNDVGLGTVRVLGYVGSVPAGVVRLFPLDADHGLWQGDRLAVRVGFRTHGLGGPLVRYAVATAGVRGGTRMVAHIQVSNVAFFTHLGWTSVGDTELYVGVPHQRMEIALPAPEAGADIVRKLGG